MYIVDKYYNIREKLLSSDKVRLQILGALLKWNTRSTLLLCAILILATGLALLIPPFDLAKYLCFMALTAMVFLSIRTCTLLLNLFSLRRKDSAITSSYIVILFTLLVWVLGFLLLYHGETSVRITAAMGLVGTILSWIFQDKIKGVATYFHLRAHKLLNVGDWIQLPSAGVDGMVTRITLQSVTISNWDTTTSIIPINSLSTSHFMNFQNMLDGKTYGRKMSKTFVLDTGWFHLLTADDVQRLKTTGDVIQYLPEEDICVGVSNAKLFRLYLYHRLSNHPHISIQPRLIIRWLEQVENGMPLEIYAFITDSGIMSFEWQQSQIIEQVIEALDWFGLRLYQSPSSYDVSNNNVFLSDKPATYRL